MSQRVSVHGPNIGHGGEFHIHRAGCSDTKRGEYLRTEPGWTIEATSERAVVEEIYSDIIAESGGTWQDYVDTVRFFPCVSLPTETDDRGASDPAEGRAPMKVRIVTAPEPRTKPGMMPSLINPAWSAGTPATEGLFAAVEVDEARLELSRMPGETEWTVDAAYAPGSSCPSFANGFGARYLRTRVVAAEIAAVLAGGEVR